MDNNTLTICICLLIGLLVLIIAIPAARTSSIKKKMQMLADNTLEVTPQEFFKTRNASNGGRGRKHISGRYNFTGVYIIFNKTKNMFYVGQSKNVFSRVNNHFTGHGNGDVYADFKTGDEFTIKMVSLEGSGCSSLNELERNYIGIYKAYSKGYNKTRGNKG